MHRRRPGLDGVVQIANHKVPRAIEIVDELPVNATGKVVKDELRARALAGLLVVELGVWVAAPAAAALLADSDAPAPHGAHVPAIGEHTDKVLSELDTLGP